MEAAHTATPWKAITSPGGIWSVVDKDNSRVCDVGYAVKSKANAAFIVRACNNHDAFVSVLESIAHDATLTTLDMVALARTAIAKAGAA
jgi:hypothetical protein